MAINSRSFGLVSFVLFFVCSEAARTLSSLGHNNHGVFDGSVGADGGIQNSAGINTPVGSLNVSHGATAAIEGDGGATTRSNVITPLAEEKLFNLNGNAGASAEIQNGARIETPVGTIGVSHGVSAALGGSAGAIPASNVVAVISNGRPFRLVGDAGADASIQNGATINTPIGTIGASHGVNAAVGGGAGATSTSNIVTAIGNEKFLDVGWDAGAKAGIGGSAGITTPLGSVQAGVGAQAGANAGATGGIGEIPTTITP